MIQWRPTPFMCDFFALVVALRSSKERKYIERFCKQETLISVLKWVGKRFRSLYRTGKREIGIIKRVIRSQNRVIVEGGNLVKKHIMQGQGHEGGIFTVEPPLHASNVQPLDPTTGKPCKVGIKYLEDGTRVRVSRGQGASGSIIPRPEILKIRTTPRPTTAGPKDTPMELVLEKTYDAKTGLGMPNL